MNELQSIGEFEPSDPEYIAWQAARDAYREEFSARLHEGWALDDMEQQLEDDSLVALDPSYAEILEGRADMVARFHEVVMATSEEREGQFLERQRLRDINDYLRYRQAKQYAEEYGGSLEAALVKLFGGSDDMQRWITNILKELMDEEGKDVEPE